MKVLVFGGTGLVGSAVCRLAVKRGWEVTSCTRRGEAFKTQTGHTPGWVDKVQWRKATAFDPTTYTPLLANSDAVVSTLGILMEQSYKSDGVVSPLALLRGVANQLLGDRGNPLAENKTTYESMNRDAALAIFRAFSSQAPTVENAEPSPFVYLSAEDVFRPFVSERYIGTKREAEVLIAQESLVPSSTGRTIRPVFVRPSLIYHPHYNPASTLPATLIDLSSRAQSRLPAALRISTSFPPSPSALSSFANLLTLPPIHVDTVAESICQAIERPELKGVLGVREMRELKGFDDAFDLEFKRKGKNEPAGTVVL